MKTGEMGRGVGKRRELPRRRKRWGMEELKNPSH